MYQFKYFILQNYYVILKTAYRSKMINQEDQAQRLEQLAQIIVNSQNKHFYCWSQNKKAWIMLNPKVHSQKNSTINQNQFPSNKINGTLRAVTLNVLFDFRSQGVIDEDMGHMKYSKQRYSFIFKKLQQMKATVISLNQVTKQFVKLLQKQQWVRKQYYLSVIHDSKSFNFCFGNILLTKLKPFALNIFKVPQLPRPIMIGFFLLYSKKQHKNVISFSSIHLIAYDNKWEIRKAQLKHISNYLQKFKKVVNQNILMGDFNFHSEKQNQTSMQNKLKDCWLELYDLQKNSGYTFDSVRNSFIKQLYWGFEQRRMRLDRVFLSTHQKLILKPVQMKVCFDQPIFEHQVQEGFMFVGKSALSYLADKFKNNLFRKKQDYLFCSDHFGLETVFLFNQE